MTRFQDGTWWDSNLRVDVCPIPRSPPYPRRHRLPIQASRLRRYRPGHKKKKNISLHPSIYPSIHQASQPAHLFIHPSIRPYIHPAIHLNNHPSMYPITHPSNQPANQPVRTSHTYRRTDRHDHSVSRPFDQTQHFIRASVEPRPRSPHTPHSGERTPLHLSSN
ncbi:hypothetical protein E2C01_046964 [Portunus trituberculatus]|uniref:Uncharacterized protein n=1 Tax=Portunus trituberculatus TaxID=210409 RepID=A0A5B7FZ54_PORTR|nr:hypothetical protein [Portunus trituberculatus]